MDFNDFDRFDFWRLGDKVEHRPMELGKRKKWHRWGILVLLFKEKEMVKVRAR